MTETIAATPMNYERIAESLRNVADVNRLRILAMLAVADSTVSALAEAGGVSLTNTSLQLRLLRAGDYVSSKRNGQSNVYGITEKGRRMLALAQSVV